LAQARAQLRPLRGVDVQVDQSGQEALVRPKVHGFCGETAEFGNLGRRCREDVSDCPVRGHRDDHVRRMKLCQPDVHPALQESRDGEHGARKVGVGQRAVGQPGSGLSDQFDIRRGQVGGVSKDGVWTEQPALVQHLCV
jgi:hypothetical protein